MNKKVYLDCTFTYHSGLNTGIQRVVRNILARHQLAQEKFGYEFQPVVCILGRYYKIPADEVLRRQPALAVFGRRIKKMITEYRLQIQSIFGKSRPVVIVLDYTEMIMRKIFSLFKFMRMYLIGFMRRKSRVDFEAGSVFVLLDAFWAYDVVEAFSRSNKGVKKVVSVIYDLIPVYHSKFVEEVNCQRFSQALPRLFLIVDQFVCISESVAQDLRKYRAERSLPSRCIGSFRLGGDFVLNGGNALSSNYNPASELVDIFAKQESWLVVGTIEPRKNHKFILDAFDELWEEGFAGQLVIVGRVGWMCEDVIERIKSHQELNKKLYFLESISDEDLQFCYSRTCGLIFASHAEGFGLPLVEAMSKGIRVVCSDIPVFKEVGGGYPTYFQLGNIESLKVVLKAAPQVQYKKSGWPTWDDSLGELSGYFI